MLDQMVHYTFDQTNADYVRMRNTNGGLSLGLPDTRAGDTRPPFILHEYGSNVVDLVVLLRGPGRHVVMNVPQGTAGQQGRWVVAAWWPFDWSPPRADPRRSFARAHGRQ